MRHKLFHREKASLCESSIQPASCVSLAQQKAIAFGAPGCSGVYIQNAAVKHGQDIGARKNRSYMRSAAYVRHSQCMQTNPPGQVFGAANLRSAHAAYP
jgi:hypothetical protein